MKSDSFTFDRQLYALLQQEGFEHFTTRDVRDAYARHLEGMNIRLSDVRRYVYKQIRRMLRIGWIVQDEDRPKRGQVYHKRSLPDHLRLNLVDSEFLSKPACTTKVRKGQVRDLPATPKAPPDTNVTQHLETLLKEVRLDFLSSMGEAERYKQILEEIPHIRDQVEGEYLQARDRSSRLLGHLRAVEKTLKTLTS